MNIFLRNNYGIILNQFGFNEILNEIILNIIEPISKYLFPNHIKSEDSFKSNHSFLIKYKIGEDISLKEHIDQSDITLNVCLGKEFKGSEVYFKGLKNDNESKDQYFEYHSTIGNSIIHLGNHVGFQFYF